MADVTNAPVPLGTDEFDVPGDLQALADHFGGGDMFYKPTPADLPMTGNWPGREMYVQSDGTTRKWTGASWVIIAKTATAPGSIVPTPGAGVTLTDNTLHTRNGWLIGTIQWSKTTAWGHGETLMTFPVGARPVAEYGVITTGSPAPTVLFLALLRPDGIVSPLTPPASRTSGNMKFTVPLAL